MGTVRTLVRLLALCALLLLPAPGSRAQPAGRYFPETGHTVAGRFLAYWDANGGLPQFGLPLTDELQEPSASDDQLRAVQYFERAVFEAHPEYALPYDVLLSLLGGDRYREQYGPDGAPNQHPTVDNPLLFPATGHSVGGDFRAYWERHGGLLQFGYPISDEFSETSALDGQPHTVQYFERAVFERHPEYAGSPFAVELAQLGRYQDTARHGMLVIPGSIQEGFDQAGPVGSNTYLIWTEAHFRMDPFHNLFQVRGLDLRTGQPFTITNPVNPPSAYSLDGSTLVWTEPGMIRGKNLATGTPFVIATLPDARVSPVIAGHRVAWLGLDETQNEATIKDLDTGMTSTLTTPSIGAGQQSLQMSEEYLVWLKLRYVTMTPGYAIFCYNLQSHQLQTVAGGQFYGPRLGIALSGHELVVAGDELSLINLDTGNTSLLDSHSFTSPYPAMRGNTVIWGDKGPIFGLKLTDRIPRLLFGGPLSQLTIAGSWIVGTDSSGPEGIRLHATRLYDAFATPSP